MQPPAEHTGGKGSCRQAESLDQKQQHDAQERGYFAPQPAAPHAAFRQKKSQSHSRQQHQGEIITLKPDHAGT